MTRSGIKQGLAISAVSALSIVGLPAAAHAASTPVPPTAVSASVSAASVTAFQTDNLTISGTAPSGDVASGNVTVTLTEASSSAVTFADPAGAVAAGVAGTYSATAGTTTLSYTTQFGADGTVTIPVGSDTPGTINVKVTAANGNSATTSFVVGAGAVANGGQSVGKIDPASKTITDTVGDWATDGKSAVTVTPETAAGVPLSNAELYYTETGTNKSGTLNDGSPVAITPTASNTFSAQPYSVSINLAGENATGTSTVKVWANHADTDATADPASTVGSMPAAGDPTATFTINLTPNDYTVGAGTTTADIKAIGATGSAVAVTGANTAGQLPADKATTVPVVLTVKNGTGDVAANVPVAFDVYGGLATTGPFASQKIRFNGTTDSKGQVTWNVPVTAALAADGNVIAGQFFVTKSTTVGVGQALADYTAPGSATELVKFKTPATQNVAAKAIQAAVKGQVSATVTLKDQFGAPVAAEVLSYSVTGKNATTATATVTTNASGEATISYTDSKAAAGEQDVIHVTDVTHSGVTIGDITVNYLASVAAAKVTFASEPGTDTNATVSADTTAPAASYKVAATTADGSALTAPITVSVNNGWVASDNSATPAKKGASITVDPGATFYVGSTKAGAQTVTATSGAASVKSAHVVNYANTGVAYGVTVAPSSAFSITTGASQPVTVSVTDKYGNVMGGVNVEFDAAGVGSFGTGANVSAGQTGSVTGAYGTSLVAGSVAGSGTLTVGVAGVDTTKDADATVALGAAKTEVKYTVHAPVVTPPAPPVVKHPTAAEKKLAHDQAKLAKDKKALKHAKGHKKAQLKKAIKALKKAIKADKKAIAASK